MYNSVDAMRERLAAARKRGLKITPDVLPQELQEYFAPVLQERRGDTSLPAPCLEPVPKYSLHEFMERAWHVVEPATPRYDNWHVKAICDHLEACTLGREIVVGEREDSPGQVVRCGSIRNLIINIPPRCEKSLLVSVFWPCWVWTFRPSARWLFASYAETLSIRDSVKCRNIMQSVWYQKEFGHVFQLVGDQNAKQLYQNTETGYRLATSVLGVGTGQGGDFVVVDDPHNTSEAESETIRQNTVKWWNESMSTRGNNPNTVVRVIVMQRQHEEDLTGDQLRGRTHYEHLCLPMRYEDTVEAALRRTSIGFSDPRSEDGELLWPMRFPDDAVKGLEQALGSYAAAGQLQQRPAPREGGMFKEAWIRTRRELPARCRFVAYWDKASTAGGGAYTAGTLMAEHVISGRQREYFVVEVKRGQWSANERNVIMRETCLRWRRTYGTRLRVFVEQEMGSAGKDVTQTDIDNLRGLAAKMDHPTGDKETRAQPLSASFEAGNCWLIEGPWNQDYIDELINFPNGKYKDQVDSSSGAYTRLTIPSKDESKAIYGGENGYVKGWNMTRAYKEL